MPCSALPCPKPSFPHTVAPVCSAGQKWVYGATLGQAVNVSCRVEAFPPPSSFRWVFNTSTEYLELSQDVITSHGGESVAAYTPLTHHDFGSLLCWASNQVAVQGYPCVFHVVPASECPGQVIRVEGRGRERV